MQTLLDFLLKFKNFFLFLLLELVCVLMIVANNQFQRFHILTSSNYALGYIYSWRADVTRYFSLTEVNDNLRSQNALLQSELTKARNRIAALEADTTFAKRKEAADEANYTFISARVISVQTDAFKNLITIDKGTSDGIRKDMGVICDKGVVGIVCNTSEHFSIVLPIVNTSSQISAKVRGKNSSSNIVWEGDDIRYASLEEVPLYVPVMKGDAVVTSGYSSIFPAGIMVGNVHNIKKGSYDFYEIDVKLSTDFLGLTFVDVIDYKGEKEKKELEEESKK